MEVIKKIVVKETKIKRKTKVIKIKKKKKKNIDAIFSELFNTFY